MRQNLSQWFGIADRLGTELRVRRIQKPRLLLEPEPPSLKRRFTLRGRAGFAEYAHMQAAPLAFASRIARSCAGECCALPTVTGMICLN
ncbi:hypothetical protein RM530_15665 [Algiphilus sp. W345]|uniref:Uncharacterized protein n=1 Tax=Banduia mediterranea TaxID=3075609 RepID=A0ABU2WLM8_9GAMM|nr:hypothetical protein [Algiphilus sp. W345]MDT0498787.1 hypothetical protein [Algiphilus sp. W345]